MKKTLLALAVLTATIATSQTCNKLNHNCSNTVNLNTMGVSSNGGLTYACSLADNVLYSSSSSDPWIATDDIAIDQGMAATLHFDAKRASGYFGTCEVWVHVGGYCSFQVYDVPFNDNGWVQIGTFNPGTTCSQQGPFTVPSDVIGGQNLSYCIVLKGASSTNFVSIDNICVSQISGSAVPTSMNEDFGTSSSGWYPNTGVDDIPYHTYKNASDAYTILGTGADGFPDKAAYFYTGFDFCSSVSGVGIITKEVNTSGYANGEIRLEFKSKYPCSGTNSYTFDENYQSYSPEIFVMTGADHGSNTWTPLPVNYYFADYNWRVASYDISAYQNANVRFKIERGGFCGTSMEAVDNIKILDRDCSISLLSCGTITGDNAPLQNTNYNYSVPAVVGATYYKWYVRHEGNLYDAAPYIVSGQGTQNVTINFQTLPSSGVRVLCIPFDADPSIDPDACYAQIGYLGVTVSASNPLTLDNAFGTDAFCFGACDGTAQVVVSGGQTPYTYTWSPNVSTSDIANGLCAGDYDVTITDNNSDQVTTTITIGEPTPVTVVCGGGPTICAGDTAQLSPTVGGGTPPYTYFWTPATNISSQTDPNPFVWPTSSVPYSVEATDANGCVGNCGVVVSVNPAPTADFSADLTTGCEPLTVSFMDQSTGGISCNWQFGDGGSSSVCSDTYTYTTDGTYTVSLFITDVNGCTDLATFTDYITVLPSPSVDAGADSTICEGDQITLTAFNPDGATISWDNGVTDGVAFTPSVDTIYVVTADLSGCQATDSVEVLIDPVPTVDLGADITSCDPFVTLDAGAGMDAYSWSNTQTTQTIDATSSGTYWVLVTQGICTNQDTVEVTLLDCTGLIELDGQEIEIYPNPVTENLTLRNLPLESVIRIYDLKGAEVYFGVYSEETITIDLSALERGTYMLQVTDGLMSESVRIIKQ